MFGRLVLAVAGNRAVRTAISDSPLSRPVVSRFVAGEDDDAAITAVLALQRDGLHATLDHLGEDITDAAQAAETVAAYRKLVSRLADAGLAEGNEISLKLSALGQALGADGPARATGNAHELADHAYAHGVDVTIDMEDHTTIDDTLETVRSVRTRYPRVGCVLQAMLKRTEGDVRDLGEPGSRVRLVKGAYAEPGSVALTAKNEVDRAYVRYLRLLAESGAYPMVATHDPRIITIAESVLTPAGAPAEFQMLYGIRAAEQQRLAAAGHTVRVYIPYGTDWYGYFSRRLAERPANVGFLLRQLTSR
ncbi:proline dehydrogenase family protein [Actinoplanes sp. TFC3]|uniref:proline dehydrogenase family protein n=1 Tax=Actinoplanes sp. TFC3 TaxID=1710355 RepID=UPI000836A187|nr:proline dehydrogenase family protein [Actinoplanes sp. TFC3]